MRHQTNAKAGRTARTGQWLAALLLTLGVAGTAAAHSQGTLPLRLPTNASGGTLPLKLSGESQTMGTPNAKLDTLVTVTSATQAALPQSATNTLRCQTEGDHISKHAAQGTVLVGDLLYTLRGICFNQTTHAMELVASRGGGAQSFMVGDLQASTPGAFSGRMTLVGAQAGRYVFDTQRIGEPH
jgi:hypothetical protein